MQTFGWYLRRLRAMSASEVARRVWRVTRAPLDARMSGRRSRKAAHLAARTIQHGALLDGGRPSLVAADAAELLSAAARCGLVTRGRRLVDGHLPNLGFDAYFGGGMIDWNCDSRHRIQAPRGPAARIDYRDFGVTGDAKLVWEPNRHQHLVVLGRAYRATGDVTYAKTAAAHLRQWVEQCPYGRGMNWRSPLELAIRLINWVATLELIAPAAVLSPEDERALLASILLHVSDITRQYSFGSSANNHLIGEAAGVYIAGQRFADVPALARQVGRSREILTREILAQSNADGGTCEQAVGYHVFVLQFFTLAALAGRRCGDEFPREYWERLHRMYLFLAALAEGGERLPMFGDADDGYVLDIDADPLDARPWLAVGAALFGDSRLDAAADGRGDEAVLWLLGDRGIRDCETQTQRADAAPQRLMSQAFAETGLYLLQHGTAGDEDAVSVVFDCGPLGFGPLAAHGHADALSFVLRVGGVDVLVDPGTYDYFTYPQSRAYYRSTQAHNTITVDAADQSVMLGSFLWGERADARVVEWAPTRDGGRIVGEHDGYRRLADAVVHRRELRLAGEEGALHVRDELRGGGQHSYATYFHLAENCRVVATQGNELLIDTGAGSIAIELDARLKLEVRRAEEGLPLGWVSRGYHRKSAGTVVVGRCGGVGVVTLLTRISIRRHARGTVRAAVETAAPVHLTATGVLE